MNRDSMMYDPRQADAALRERLNDMSAVCQILQNRCSSERDMVYLEGMMRSILRASRILYNQELARRLEDEDELRVVYGTVELVDWCRRLTEASAKLLAAAGITLTFRADRMAMTTLADEELLSQMVLELLSNGAKHTPSGGVLTVTLQQRGGYAVITVGDEGRGIREDALVRLVERGEVEPDLTPGAGAGLGLRLARTIAESHGGLMMVDTAPEEGVRAAVTIPLREGSRERLASPADLPGGFDRELLALSDVLPTEAFRMTK